jgi:hypothetical protein
MRFGLLTGLFVTLLGFAALGQSVDVVNLDQSTLSDAEFAGALAQLAALETLLEDPTLGSQQSVGEFGWTGTEFAAFTAGALAARGYDVLIAQGGTVGPFVLVGLPVGSQTLWVPVEPVPVTGPQTTLGFVPTVTRSASAVTFDPRYTSPTTATPPRPNAAPVARIRTNSLEYEINELVKLLAMSSYDPDGEIILYRWSFGDGETKVGFSSSELHRYKEEGTYDVSVTVVDNRGAEATAPVRLRIADPEAHKMDTNSSGGCGCGG